MRKNIVIILIALLCLFMPKEQFQPVEKPAIKIQYVWEDDQGKRFITHKKLLGCGNMQFVCMMVC